MIVALVDVIIGIICYIEDKYYNTSYLLYTLVIINIIYAFYYFREHGKINHLINIIQYDVLARLIPININDAKFNFNKGIGEDHYNYANMFRDADDFGSYHYISGKVYNGNNKHITFEVSDLATTYDVEEMRTREISETDSHGHTSYHTETYYETVTYPIFSGQMFIIHSPISFKYTVQIAPQNHFRNQINMDNPNFDYSVVCNDKIYAFSLLTKEFMNKILDLSKYLGSHVYITFRDSYIYLFVSNVPLFEKFDVKKIEKSLNNYENDLYYIKTVVEKLDFQSHSLCI